MAANSDENLKSYVSDELRTIMCLAKAAESILGKILVNETSGVVNEYIGSFHRVIKELMDWSINLGGSLAYKTCCPMEPNNRHCSEKAKEEFGHIIAKLRAIEAKAELHHREWEDRVMGNPTDVSIPPGYNPHDTLVELFNLFTEFIAIFE